MLRPQFSPAMNAGVKALLVSADQKSDLIGVRWDFAKSLADHYLVMSRGEIIKQGLGKNMDSENIRACLAL